MNSPACFYCSGTDFQPWVKGIRDRLRYVQGEWVFVQCLGCGSALLQPQPNPSDLASFYPPIYDLSRRQMEKGPLWKRFLARLEYSLFFQPQYLAQAGLIRESLGAAGSQSLKLLDIGCGEGLRLLALKKAVFVVEGADFREETVAALKKSGIPAFLWDVNQTGITAASGSYDVVTAFHLVEHLADVATFLREAGRLLKPGGCLIFTVPIMESIQAKLFGARWCAVTEAPRHLSIPSRKGIQRQLNQTGFQGIRINPDTLLNEIGTAVLSVLPAAGRRHFEGPRRNQIKTLFLQILAVGTGFILFPFCLLGQSLHQSAIVMVTARKPALIPSPS